MRLEQTAAFGVTTNQAFLAACLAHPVFAAGEATTAFIGQHRDELLAPRADAASEAALAAVLLYVTDPFAPPWRSGQGGRWRRPSPLPARIELDHGIHEIEIGRERDGGYLATLENTAYRIEIHALDGDSIRFSSNGLMESARFLRDGDRLFVLHRGITIAVRDLTLAQRLPRPRRPAATARSAPP